MITSSYLLYYTEWQHKHLHFFLQTESNLSSISAPNLFNHWVKEAVNIYQQTSLHFKANQ